MVLIKVLNGIRGYLYPCVTVKDAWIHAGFQGLLLKLPSNPIFPCGRQYHTTAHYFYCFAPPSRECLKCPHAKGIIKKPFKKWGKYVLKTVMQMLYDVDEYSEAENWREAKQLHDKLIRLLSRVKFPVAWKGILKYVAFQTPGQNDWEGW